MEVHTTEVNPRDPGRRTYAASRAWMPWVRAYNARARVTEGSEVVAGERKAAESLRVQYMRKKAQCAAAGTSTPESTAELTTEGEDVSTRG